MSYNFITSYNSPAFTPGREGRRISDIAIHWWNDPSFNPTFEGTCAYLSRAGAQTSAHFVAEAGRVACLVDVSNTAWHAGSWVGNLTSIGIECNPRMSDGDINTVAELIKDLRNVNGDLILRPHSFYTSTRCPGVWRDNLGMQELDRRARGIIAPGDKEFTMNANDVWNFGLGTDGIPGHNDQPAWTHLSYAHSDTAYMRPRIDDIITKANSINEKTDRIIPMLEAIVKRLDELEKRETDTIADRVASRIGDGYVLTPGKK